MRKQIRHSLIILLTLAISLPCSSYENDDDFFDDGFFEGKFYRHHYCVEQTWRLCNHTWYYSYYDRYGNFHEEVLLFSKERRGKMEFYFNGRMDRYEYFGWHWDNYNQTRIWVDYANGNYDLLYDVWVSHYELIFISNGTEYYYQAE